MRHCYEMHYILCNQGDGSASLQVCQSKRDAEAALSNEGESVIEGPASLQLSFDTETNMLSFRDLEYNEDSMTYDWVWVPLRPALIPNRSASNE